MNEVWDSMVNVVQDSMVNKVQDSMVNIVPDSLVTIVQDSLVTIVVALRVSQEGHPVVDLGPRVLIRRHWHAVPVHKVS